MDTHLQRARLDFYFLFYFCLVGDDKMNASTGKKKKKTHKNILRIEVKC